MPRTHATRIPSTSPAVRAVVAALVLAAGGVDRGVAAPSFDCLKAEAPIEKLICSDPTLDGLDAALGEAFAVRLRQLGSSQQQQLRADQRAWLGERLRSCMIAAQGQELTVEQRWTSAPCLADMYRQRLAQLGAPRPADPPPEIANRLGFIHPLCLEQALGVENERRTGVDVPLRACNRGNRHIAIDVRDNGWISANNSTDGFGGWFAYRLLDSSADDRAAVQIEWSGGGTGRFTEIAEIRRAPATDSKEIRLSARTLIGGGDRCMGGIDDANRLADGSIAVDFRVTATGFLEAAEPSLPADAATGELFDCAVCCFATVRVRADPDGRRQTLMSATIEDFAADDRAADRDGAQACLERIVKTAAGQLPRTFSPPELKAVAADFVKSCTGLRR